MECPFCNKPLTEVTNSRPTRGNSQIRRRRVCLNCKEIFSTHESIDLSHLLVTKKSGRVERYSRMKLYAGIFYSAQATRMERRELFVDKITGTVEKEILSLKKKKIETKEIAEIVLKVLRKNNTAIFLRFLTYFKDIKNDTQMRRELSKYIFD